MPEFAILELLAQSPTIFIVCSLVVGCLVGSFLNVVIYRYPIMLERDWQHQATEILQPEKEHTTNQPTERFDLIKPDSRCPKCQHKIRAWENIPVISWLMLRAKCSQCSSPISVRYPLIELLTGILTALIAAYFGYSILALFAMLAIWLLIAMSFIDLDTTLLPDTLTLPFLWLGLIASTINPEISPTDAIWGAVFGYLSLWSVFWGFKLLTGKDGMGYGDFKLLAGIGAWVGWQHLPTVILLSSLVGALIGGLLVWRHKNRALQIPFGPYLAVAGFVTLLYGQAIADAYLSYLLG